MVNIELVVFLVSLRCDRVADALRTIACCCKTYRRWRSSVITHFTTIKTYSNGDRGYFVEEIRHRENGLPAYVSAKSDGMNLYFMYGKPYIKTPTGELVPQFDKEANPIAIQISWVA